MGVEVEGNRQQDQRAESNQRKQPKEGPKREDRPLRLGRRLRGGVNGCVRKFHDTEKRNTRQPQNTMTRAGLRPTSESILGNKINHVRNTLQPCFLLLGIPTHFRGGSWGAAIDSWMEHSCRIWCCRWGVMFDFFLITGIHIDIHVNSPSLAAESSMNLFVVEVVEERGAS